MKSFNFHFQSLTRPHHALVTLLFLFFSAVLSVQHIAVGDYSSAGVAVDGQATVSLDSSTNSTNANTAANANSAIQAFKTGAVFACVAVAAHVARAWLYALPLLPGPRSRTRNLAAAADPATASVSETMPETASESLTASRTGCSTTARPDSRTVRFKTPSNSKSLAQESIGAFKTLHRSHSLSDLHKRSALVAQNSVRASHQLPPPILSTNSNPLDPGTPVLESAQSNSDLHKLLQSAQNQSVIWLSMHLSKREAKCAWKACFLILGVCIASVLGSVFLSIIGIVLASRHYGLPFRDFGEGLCRACLATAFGALALILILLDTASFIRAFRLARPRLGQGPNAHVLRSDHPH
ncbi:hypothetical protein BC830DRAFT_786376 [Chytriomyces sp. MP71]|nr:hypothetical protein BC830DRAFT_786376 [Chytriomyces sp. MP71]